MTKATRMITVLESNRKWVFLATGRLRIDWINLSIPGYLTQKEAPCHLPFLMDT